MVFDTKLDTLHSSILDVSSSVSLQIVDIDKFISNKLPKFNGNILPQVSSNLVLSELVICIDYRLKEYIETADEYLEKYLHIPCVVKDMDNTIEI